MLGNPSQLIQHFHGLQLVTAALQAKLNGVKLQHILTVLCDDWVILCGPPAVRSPLDCAGRAPEVTHEAGR